MKVFKHININPTNMNLYSTAVTHSSYTNENPSYPDYERLEFLGDAVLEIIISDYLYKERKLEEGIMTKMRASYVCEEACATYAKELGLDEDIRVGTGEEINTTIMADVFEAFTAAVYLDQGFEFTKKFVLDIIVKYIENEIEFLTKKTKLELPMQDIYNMYCYEDKTSTELAKMFNCVPETIISRLRVFAKKENLPLNIREGHRRKKNLPIEQIYNEYITGISSKKLGEKYGCMHNVILNRLREYANEHNIELVIREGGPVLFKLPSEEIYIKYMSGMSLREIGDDYGCSDRCIKKRLVDYCEENDIELTMREAARRKIKLPIDEIYKKYQSGISAVVLGREYKCSNNTIIRKLREYCEENNLELNIINLELDLPVEEMYNLYTSGTSSTILAEKYNCSEGTIVNRIKKYCKQNKIEMPPTPVKKKGNKKIASNVTGEEIYNLYLDGYTIGDIAKSKNLTKRTISEELYAYLEREGKNLKIRNGRKRQELPSEKLYLEYRSGKTMQEIAEEYQSSATTIADRVISYCKANNISFPKHNIRVNEETCKKIYELSRGGMQQVKIAKETGYGKKKIERILKNEYKKAFLEQLKKMLEEKQIKKEIDTNVKVKKY